MSQKRLLGIAKARRDQVGDGFEIRRPLPGPQFDSVDPYLLLDHMGPTEVEPSDTPRGVDEHPHKGFETVTVVLQGELEHRDSAGNSGHLNEGDVQWMTAGSGLVHEEKYGREFTKRGGTIEGVQLWVNLPARFKGEKPHYQDIRDGNIPRVPLKENAGRIRVISGRLGDLEGAAKTHTAINLFDVAVDADVEDVLQIPDGHSAALYAVRGSIAVGDETVHESELAVFDTSGTDVTFNATAGSRFLVIGGEPIGEPVVAYGPFVMNTREEIQQAYLEYREGKMGTLDVHIS